MAELNYATKELVYTYCYTDLPDNRADEVISVVNGRTIVELGTRTATTIVGNIYKVFDSSVKSFKYLLLVGVARQNPYWDFEIIEEEAEELAAINAQVNPVITMVLDDIPESHNFINLCEVFIQSIQGKKLIKTSEEKNAEQRWI